MTDTCMTTQSGLIPFPVNAVCENSAPEWASELLLSFSGFKYPRISDIPFRSSNGSDSQDTSVVYIVYEPLWCLKKTIDYVLCFRLMSTKRMGIQMRVETKEENSG